MSEFSRLVELIGSLPAEEWANLARSAPEPTPSAPPELGPKELFELARERLERLGIDARAEGERVRETVQAARPERSRPAPAPPQISLAVRSGEDGWARARFALDNPTGLDQTLSFRPSEVRSEGGERWLPLRFTPARPRVKAGDGLTISLEVDVRELARTGVPSAEMDVEVHRGGRIAALVWVRLEIEPA